MLVGVLSRPLQAQETPASPHQHTPVDGKVSLFQPREASGTAWVPAATPMDGLHGRVGSWQLMVHGAIFGQWLYESGNRHRTGGFQSTQFSSVNWGMVMARRRVGTATIGLRAMLSAEPWTVGNCGFINLLASGEMCEGDTIHDRQHPHDTFMELAAEYDRPVNGRLRWQLYGGLSGEPALGPPGFPHRPSAAPNPIAPVTHHWLDSTHITFGLITTGIYTDRWKIEGSVFNSREPDARRTNIDLGPLDSVAARLCWAPSSRLTAQVSAGHLHQSEAEFAPLPRSDVNRATASLMYQSGSESAQWATTVAYGVNGGTEIIPGAAVFLVTHGGLVESTLTIRQRHIWFGRIEAAGKPGHDLHVHETPARIIPAAKVELGYTRRLGLWNGVSAGLGGVVTANLLPESLAPRYSGHVAWGLGSFIVLRPSQPTSNGK